MQRKNSSGQQNKNDSIHDWSGLRMLSAMVSITAFRHKWHSISTVVLVSYWTTIVYSTWYRYDIPVQERSPQVSFLVREYTVRYSVPYVVYASLKNCSSNSTQIQYKEYSSTIVPQHLYWCTVVVVQSTVLTPNMYLDYCTSVLQRIPTLGEQDPRARAQGSVILSPHTPAHLTIKDALCDLWGMMSSCCDDRQGRNDWLSDAIPTSYQ